MQKFIFLAATTTALAFLVPTQANAQVGLSYPSYYGGYLPYGYGIGQYGGYGVIPASYNLGIGGYGGYYPSYYGGYGYGGYGGGYGANRGGAVYVNRGNVGRGAVGRIGGGRRR